ncbi:unnamed protein product [Allacma fusca]|uniref:Uncharacterized protein n=1 Tax=Allacma fusca TaxID=39272 RepID=A0A8J2MCK3_9HEXA|nr:unnamed protein product [Allacma fusca]
MEPPRKKQRIQDGSDDTEASRSTPNMVDTSGASGCSVFPTLVFAIFIETATLNILKTCRLVCKSWNHAACNVLRSRSCVSISENEKRLKDFRKLIFDGAFLPEMPSPFKNFTAYGENFTDGCFKSILHIPYMVLESFTLPLLDNTAQKELEKLLVVKGPRIKSLVMNLYDDNSGFRPDPALLTNEQVQLSGLKHLQLCEMFYLRNINNFELIKKLTQYSALEKIDLMIKDANILDQILTPVNLSTVKILKLIVSHVSNEDFERLENLRMPLLRDFEVRIGNMRDEVQGHRLNEKRFQQIASLVGNVSSTIKVLSSNALRLKLLPVCPKLEEIHVSRFDSCVPDFSLATFPNLTSIKLSLDSSWRFLKNGFIPHSKVTEVNIDVTSISFDFEMMILDEDSFHIFLHCLNRKFPNIQKLSLSLSDIPFTPQVFQSLNQAFPSLKALRIGSSCDFDSITGRKFDDLHYYLEFGWPVEDVPRRNSILEFKALVSLDLVGLDVTITREMILYCLGKIPTLKFLKFYWNHQLQSHNVRDSLGHLEKIFVINLFPPARNRNPTPAYMFEYVNDISELDAKGI